MRTKRAFKIKQKAFFIIFEGLSLKQIQKFIFGSWEYDFKKHVRDFCTINKIKMVGCQFYHPQTQGKVECSHHILRPKNYYDMEREKSTEIIGQNSYSIMLDVWIMEKGEELGWKSPF